MFRSLLNHMTQHLLDKGKPKILISGHLPPPMGGIATFYQSLMNSSLPQHIDLCFVQTSSRKRTLSQSGRFTLSNLISALHDCGRFTRAVIKFRPQLTHIATAFGLSFVKHSVCVIIARFSGSRVLLHPHCSIKALYGDRSRWWQWFFRQIIRLTNGVISLSTEWNQLTAIVPGCPVYYLPNAIDLSVYRAVGLERRVDVKNPPHFMALYLGYLGKTKGSYDLVEVAREAVSENLPIIFKLVGEELSKGDGEQLQTQIDRAGLGNVVTLLPPVMGDNKLDLFREADIFVYPSYSEGMPIAVIEAMACGLPIIATRVGGLPDLVIDGINGILVDAGCANQLVGALKNLISNPDQRIAMQLNSYRIAFDQHDIEKLVPRLVSIYIAALR